jgi:hypothetical protein
VRLGCVCLLGRMGVPRLGLRVGVWVYVGVRHRFLLFHSTACPPLFPFFASAHRPLELLCVRLLLWFLRPALTPRDIASRGWLQTAAPNFWRHRRQTDERPLAKLLEIAREH